MPERSSPIFGDHEKGKTLVENDKAILRSFILLLEARNTRTPETGFRGNLSTDTIGSQALQIWVNQSKEERDRLLESVKNVSGAESILGKKIAERLKDMGLIERVYTYIPTPEDKQYYRLTEKGKEMAYKSIAEHTTRLSESEKKMRSFMEDNEKSRSPLAGTEYYAYLPSILEMASESFHISTTQAKALLLTLDMKGLAEVSYSDSVMDGRLSPAGMIVLDGLTAEHVDKWLSDIRREE